MNVTKKIGKAIDWFLRKYLLIGLIVFGVAIAIDLIFGADNGIWATIYDGIISIMVIWVFALPIPIIYNIYRQAKNIANKRAGIVESEEVSTEFDEKTRTAIVRRFNDKWGLNLTDNQIETIVGSSFQSLGWEMEIEDMSKKYVNLASWYSGDTAWLRAYLYAFNVNTISSDMEYQEKICIDIFDQIFSYIEDRYLYSVDDCIRVINEKFLTNFDDISFMIAYRFLEQSGKHHVLPVATAINIDEELDKVLKKYETETMR